MTAREHSGKADRVGILDVAAAAGVSVTTVSHALSGQGKVSPSTQEKVKRIAGELGYVPNRIATALRLQRSGIIGFVSDEVATTPFAGRMVLGAQDGAAELDQLLMVVNTNRNPDIESRQIEALLSQQVDSIVYATMFHHQVTLPPALARVPTVVINGVDLESSAPSIVPDEFEIGATATRRLLSAGHSHIAHITVDDQAPGALGRIEGYTSTMRAAGKTPLVIAVPTPADSRAGRDGLDRALAQDFDVTAVFCFNDALAMGVYQRAGSLGMGIPDDLSVVAVDNLEIISAQVLPGMTTVALPHYEMGRWGVRMLADLVSGLVSDPETIREKFECSLVERGSVAPPRIVTIP